MSGVSWDLLELPRNCSHSRSKVGGRTPQPLLLLSRGVKSRISQGTIRRPGQGSSCLPDTLGWINLSICHWLSTDHYGILWISTDDCGYVFTSFKFLGYLRLAGATFGSSRLYVARHSPAPCPTTQECVVGNSVYSILVQILEDQKLTVSRSAQ